MNKTLLGNTEISVSRAGFGVLALGQNHKDLSLEEGAELLFYGFMRGINFFDTAQYYDEYPLMRAFIDKVLSSGHEREELVICSKSLASDREEMAAAIDEALCKMGLEYLDVFLMHEVRSGQLQMRSGALEALKEAKASGKVRAIGLSTHHSDVASEAASMEDIDCVFALLNIEGLGIRTGEDEGPGESLPGYGVSDRAGTREEMEAALTACHEAGKGVLTMKALGGGNLAASYVDAMNYVFTRPFTNTVMVGMSSAKEVDDLLDLLEGRMDSCYVPDIGGKALKVNHDDCVGCGECIKACVSGAIDYGSDGLAEIDQELCIDCGYCAYACPVRAIIRV